MERHKEENRIIVESFDKSLFEQMSNLEDKIDALTENVGTQIDLTTVQTIEFRKKNSLHLEENRKRQGTMLAELKEVRKGQENLEDKPIQEVRSTFRNTLKVIELKGELVSEINYMNMLTTKESEESIGITNDGHKKIVRINKK